MLEYREAMAEQHAKLSDFLTFKAQSRKLSQQYSKLHGGNQMMMNQTGFSSEDGEKLKNHRGSLMSEKTLKITYSFDGKVMPVKEVNLDERKIVAPKILIQEGTEASESNILNSRMSQRTVTTR